MRVLVVLLSLILISIGVQSVTAARFSIYVSDPNDLPAEGAFVRIWQDSDLLDSGYTDNSGVFVTYLNDGGYYRIKAEDSGNWDEKPRYYAESAASDRISLRLHN